MSISAGAGSANMSPFREAGAMAIMLPLAAMAAIARIGSVTPRADGREGGRRRRLQVAAPRIFRTQRVLVYSLASGAVAALASIFGRPHTMIPGWAK